MANDALDRDGNLPLAFSTWVYRLHEAGIAPDDAELNAACERVHGATERAAGDEAGMTLVQRVSTLFGDEGCTPGDVTSVARRLYGDRVREELGSGDREARTTRIRKFQFDRSLPWLARIWERRDGRVLPSWLLVERVTDEVTAMDPNPWNDIDETRRLPVADFQVLWELDDCTAIAVE